VVLFYLCADFRGNNRSAMRSQSSSAALFKT